MKFAGGDVNLYGYVQNNPVNFIDPDGLFLDILADISFIAYDLYKIATDPCNRGEHLTALGLDVGGLFIPFATGLGTAYKASKGLTTPKKFFGRKTARGASKALVKNFGSPKSVREGAETFYNHRTKRSFNVHTDPAHGPPHVDIRRRGGFTERKYPLMGE